LRSCGRSLRAPLCFSANSFVAPAALSSAKLHLPEGPKK
jgi:hypothetical protein